MIVESAFLKIPEILLSHESPDLLYEANITNLFTSGVILELNARNINNPLQKIHMEKRYDSEINARCDVFLDFSSFMNQEDYIGYSVSPCSWIEAKYFGGINRNRGHETKSENAGSIIYDLFRLINLTNHRENMSESKYSLNVFNKLPTKYLAFSRANRERRQWVEALTSYGVNQLHFDLSEEPNTIKKFFNEYESIVMDITVKNTIFEPTDTTHGRVYFYGYLNQILDYKLYIDGIRQ